MKALPQVVAGEYVKNMNSAKVWPRFCLNLIDAGMTHCDNASALRITVCLWPFGRRAR
jgi:hypothetical protein